MADKQNSVTPKVEPPKDEVRDKILNALKRDWLAKLQRNHPIDTVETLGPAANDFAENQLEEYEAGIIKLQQEALLNRLLTELESFPHFDRSLFRDGYTDDPADRRDMLEAGQVKTTINKIRGEL